MNPSRILICLALIAQAHLALAADPVRPASKGPKDLATQNGNAPRAAALGGSSNPSQTNGLPNDNSKGDSSPKSAPAKDTPNGKKASFSAEELKHRYDSLKEYFTEDEWKQVSHYLLDSALDSLQGTEDATLAPDLAFRLEILKRRMKVEGGTLMDEISNQWQQLMTPPPPVPYEPRPLPSWAIPSTSPSPSYTPPVYSPPPAVLPAVAR